MPIFVNIQSCSSECSKVSFPNYNSGLALTSERGQEDPMVPFPFIILRMRLLRLFFSLIGKDLSLAQEKKSTGSYAYTNLFAIVTETQIQKRGYSWLCIGLNGA